MFLSREKILLFLSGIEPVPSEYEVFMETCCKGLETDFLLTNKCMILFRLVLEQSSRHVTAKIVHHSGLEVVTASTKEWAVKKFLYRYFICIQKYNEMSVNLN
jgi:hypothetical protein